MSNDLTKIESGLVYNYETFLGNFYTQCVGQRDKREWLGRQV